jgi:hypothetical protein
MLALRTTMPSAYEKDANDRNATMSIPRNTAKKRVPPRGDGKSEERSDAVLMAYRSRPLKKVAGSEKQFTTSLKDLPAVLRRT